MLLFHNQYFPRSFSPSMHSGSMFKVKRFFWKFLLIFWFFQKRKKKHTQNGHKVWNSHCRKNYIATRSKRKICVCPLSISSSRENKTKHKHFSAAFNLILTKERKLDELALSFLWRELLLLFIVIVLLLLFLLLVFFLLLLVTWLWNNEKLKKKFKFQIFSFF